MNLSFKNVLCVCCLLLSGSVYAQVPQDLIDKAKAAGMSDTQIQQELAKRMKQEGGSVGSQATATDAKPYHAICSFLSLYLSDLKLPLPMRRLATG